VPLLVFLLPQAPLVLELLALDPLSGLQESRFAGRLLGVRYCRRYHLGHSQDQDPVPGEGAAQLQLAYPLLSGELPR
jgi:hypothetical protein